jgi:hypothetical protein
MTDDRLIRIEALKAATATAKAVAMDADREVPGTLSYMEFVLEMVKTYEDYILHGRQPS